MELCANASVHMKLKRSVLISSKNCGAFISGKNCSTYFATKIFDKIGEYTHFDTHSHKHSKMSTSFACDSHYNPVPDEDEGQMLNDCHQAKCAELSQPAIFGHDFSLSKN